MSTLSTTWMQPSCLNSASTMVVFLFFSCHFRSKFFLLCNFAGPPNDQMLIASKWESFALTPVCNPAFPDDYFLITAVHLICFQIFPFWSAELPYKVDNDFLTTNSVSVGQSYNVSLDLDNQMLVWRVTLSSVPWGQVKESVRKCK